MYLKDGADSSGLIAMPYDPFIFATPGYYHGEGLPNHPGHSWEIHLPDCAPTEKFAGDTLWQLGVDASDPSAGTFFKTAQNHPWALLIPYEWMWYQDVLTCCKHIRTFRCSPKVAVLRDETGTPTAKHLLSLFIYRRPDQGE